MKTIRQKTFLIIAIIWCNLGVAQIPNWNMESWTTTNKNLPAQWLTYGTVTKVSPGQHGSFAIKLMGDSQNGPGAVLYGMPTNNNFLGGTSFSARPDSLVGYFKYNISPGDSAWVIISFKKNGVAISNDNYTITGSNINTFQRQAFKIHFGTNDIPDTVFVGFTSTIPNANIPNTLSWVILDNVSFIGTSQNVPNPDFENWTTKVTSTLDSWYTRNSDCVSQTTDAYAGNYALKVQTFFSNGGNSFGIIQTGNTDNNGYWKPTFQINAKPTSLNGFLKYFPQGHDTFFVNVNIWKLGQMVGNGYYILSDSIDSYSLFTIPISSNFTGTPDSATIQLGIATMMNSHPNVQSVVYIDNLSFDSIAYLGINESKSQINNLNLYPNPAQTKLTINFQLLQKDKVAISIYDLNGKEVLKLSEQIFDTGSHEIKVDVSNLPNGIYFVNTQCNSSISHSKLMIAK
jgi:Secretion system C-terminal sorting domain